MKYAILQTIDQTFGYWDEKAETWTTKHPEATLYGTVGEAGAALARIMADYDGEPLSRKELERLAPIIEEVEDEAEFRSREDT